VDSGRNFEEPEYSGQRNIYFTLLLVEEFATLLMLVAVITIPFDNVYFKAAVAALLYAVIGENRKEVIKATYKLQGDFMLVFLFKYL
jgi:hypothetical protein